jgi:hypothetical protein
MTADVRALVPQPVRETSQEMKLVVFVPRDAVEQIRGALATAGAGQIGEYEVCSFASDGWGTFFGTDGSTDPAVGESGRLEEVEEVRLEMVCSRHGAAAGGRDAAAVPPVRRARVRCVRAAAQADARERDGAPAGARPARDGAADRRAAAGAPGRHADQVRAARGDGRETRRCAGSRSCPGSGGDLVGHAVDEGCELFVTGEMTHHAVLGANARGLAVLLAGHTNTERGYLPRLAEKLGGLMPGVAFEISRADRDPLLVLK